MDQENVEMSEEANKYDHRELNKMQEPFYFDPLSPGSCFLLPHGYRQGLKNWIGQERNGKPGSLGKQAGCSWCFIISIENERREVVEHAEPHIGLLQCGMKWPLWLSPRQAIVCPVSNKSQAYALEIWKRIHMLVIRSSTRTCWRSGI
ncbi:hypothetical protein HAX54_016553 [Datura stramonium]|uniref:Uncharacterized protein n=1 Tax=Datura stramonium TaxID=4076 RepID=A0ABS8S025_DATST|nr:hypothetical protein [Datura stramonium]